jgi:iron-sulfur cluster insertion protein
MNNMSPAPTVVLTERAATKVISLITEEGDMALMLRLSVSGGGCSGFSYGFSLDGESTADDKVFEFHGVKLVIDEMSLDLLGGSEIDYVDDLMASSFRISNPNASSTCGCGTSFSL